MARAMDPLSRDIRAVKRVQINRKMVDEIHLGFADGLFEMAKACVLEAVVPDAPPYGEGLIAAGGAAAWADGKRVAEMPRKDRVKIGAPRGAGVRSGTIIAVGGFGTRHAHLVEFGTVTAAPHPFFTPAILRTVPEAAGFVALGLAKRAYVRDSVNRLGLRSVPASGTPRTKLTAQERKARQVARVVNALGRR